MKITYTTKNGRIKVESKKDLAKRGYDVKVVTDATIEFNGLPINYEEIGIGQITTESIFSQELV